MVQLFCTACFPTQKPDQKELQGFFFFICATLAGVGEMMRLCADSPHMPLLLSQTQDTRPPCRHRTWPLPGKYADSDSGGFYFFSPRCVQNLEWLVSYQRILKVHYPKLEVSEDCLYLNIYAPAHADNGSKLPVRLPARWGVGVQTAGSRPGTQAEWLGVLDPAHPRWVKGKCNHLTHQ